jgi:hypothetical protein
MKEVILRRPSIPFIKQTKNLTKILLSPKTIVSMYTLMCVFESDVLFKTKHKTAGCYANFASFSMLDTILHRFSTCINL